MPHLTYEKEITGLVVIDPYNDFISEGGKVWDRLKDIAEANQCIPHMRQFSTPREIAVFGFSMHCIGDIVRATTRPGSTLRRFRRQHGRANPSNTVHGAVRSARFEPRAGDVVAAEHWCSSGFANTDLDLLLKKARHS